MFGFVFGFGFESVGIGGGGRRFEGVVMRWGLVGLEDWEFELVVVVCIVPDIRFVVVEMGRIVVGMISELWSEGGECIVADKHSEALGEALDVVVEGWETVGEVDSCAVGSELCSEMFGRREVDRRFVVLKRALVVAVVSVKKPVNISADYSFQRR